VKRFIGEPIKGFAERSGRGRHQDIAHQFYWGRDNQQCIRMRFYLSGTRNRYVVWWCVRVWSSCGPAESRRLLLVTGAYLHTW
jgi:TIM21